MSCELAVLARCFEGEAAVHACIEEGLEPEYFEDALLAEIYSACLSLVSEGVRPDSTGVTLMLLQNEWDPKTVGLAMCDIGLAAPGGPQNAAHYAALVADGGRLRLTNERLAQLAKRGVSSPEEASAALRAIDDLSARTQRATSIGEAMTTFFERACRVSEGKETVACVPTGIATLDEAGGPMPHELWVLGARPGTGKTTLAMQMADRAARTGLRTLIFSFEMRVEELARLQYARATGVSVTKLRQLRLTRELDSLATARGEQESLPIHVYDQRSTADQILLLAQKEDMRDKLGLVIVDYIQLIPERPGSRRTRNEEVGYASNQLKELARRCDVPVLALAQLSRDVEKRGADAKPRISDLRESGSLEQDADVVAFLHRPAQFAETELIVSKFRHGPQFGTTLRFKPRNSQFEDTKR